MTVFERRLSVTSVTPPLPSLQHWHSTFLLRDSECRSWLRPRFLSSVHHSPCTRHHAPRTTHHATVRRSTVMPPCMTFRVGNLKRFALSPTGFLLDSYCLSSLPQLLASCFMPQAPASSFNVLPQLPCFTFLSSPCYTFSALPQLIASASCPSLLPLIPASAS